jgi:hypothetical protein
MDNMQPETFTGRTGETIWKLDGKFHRTDGPAFENALTGRKTWWNYGERHREDGPAVESVHGNQWWIDGRFHRIDGPAIEYADGQVSWYLEGLRYTFDQWLAKTTGLTDEETVMLKLQYG